MHAEKSFDESHSELDNTLRLLYYTLRVFKGRLLAIKFRHRGADYTADTPEEAVRLQHLLEDSDYERAKRDPGFRDRMNQQLSGWTEEKFWRVMNNLGEQQTRLLIAIYLWTTITSKDLAVALKIDSQEALAGVVSGLSKQLEKIGVKSSEVFYVETYWVGKKKERWFNLSLGFAGAAAELSWGSYGGLDKWQKEMQARLDKMEKKVKRNRQ